MHVPGLRDSSSLVCGCAQFRARPRAVREVDGTGARVLVHAPIDQTHATAAVINEEVTDATEFFLPGGMHDDLAEAFRSREGGRGTTTSRSYRGCRRVPKCKSHLAALLGLMNESCDLYFRF